VTETTPLGVPGGLGGVATWENAGAKTGTRQGAPEGEAKNEVEGGERQKKNGSHSTVWCQKQTGGHVTGTSPTTGIAGKALPWGTRYRCGKGRETPLGEKGSWQACQNVNSKTKKTNPLQGRSRGPQAPSV